MSKIVINGGELEVRAEAGNVELVIESAKDAAGPSMRIRLVLDLESADELAHDILLAVYSARNASS